jgi:putative peptide zinc metalloprotease protein
MEKPAPASDLERRKQVKLRIRTDLDIAPQKYEGKTYYVVKDPVSLRYYRFEEQEHFIIRMMNGTATLDETQKEFEKRFRPKRLTLEDLEQFGQQLLTAGLAHNESPKAGAQLFERRKKRRRNEWLQALTNVLYIKIPIYDPDKLLTRMLPWLRWMFTAWFFTLSVGVMLAALLLVLTHFEAFREKLPSYHEFFNVKTVLYLWAALGVVKVIHEFGHGLSCKAFGGEVHEMGALFLCLSPCLYCNVSDAWTLPNKWRRIIISFAGIYVELIIAAIATFVWWNTPSQPFVNHLSLSLMVVCSVSTVVFNANPLMRFDGYYVVADWLEIPNLRDRSNRFLKNLMLEHCMGVEVQPEPYMTLGRRILFVTYAVASYLYRWIVTFSILYFLHMFLRPYRLEVVSDMLAIAAAGSLAGWPLWRLGKSLHKRGRLPDMKSRRVTISSLALAVVILVLLLLPVPVSRVRQTALIEVQPSAMRKVFVRVPNQEGAILEALHVKDGQQVEANAVLAEFRSLETDVQLEEARTQLDIRNGLIAALEQQRRETHEKAELVRVDSELAVAFSEQSRYKRQVSVYQESKNNYVLRAPRAGVVMSCPRVDAIGRLWEKDSGTPFCTIGDPRHLRALMPVSPADYRLLQEDKIQNLQVTMRVQGRAETTWKGKVTLLYESNANEVPAQLTSKLGGPVPTRPPTQSASQGQQGQSNSFQPQAQQYLVDIAFLNPDNCIEPGTLAQVKIHCRWRSCAWWIWRTASSTFDLGLI